jgi:hypothetical protein
MTVMAIIKRHNIAIEVECFYGEGERDEEVGMAFKGQSLPSD